MRRVAVLGAVLLLGACSSSAPAAPVPAVPAVPAVDGVTGEVVRLRTDEALGGQVQVRLTDSGAEPFTVTSVALRSPAFADRPASVQTAVFAPGRTIDLPVPFGAVDCAAAVDPVTAEVVLSRAGGPAETVVVPLAGDAMATVHAEECAVQRVLGYVSVAVRGFTDAGDTVVGDVVLTRVAGSQDTDVEVLALERSVLLTPVPDDPLPATLAAGEPELVLPFTVSLASCDPHVLAETKKPFVFPLSVQVQGEGAALDLPLDDVQRGALQALVDRVCG